MVNKTEKGEGQVQKMIGKVSVNNFSEVEKNLINKRTIENFPNQPMGQCPRCGLLIPDFDGIDVIAHTLQPNDKWPPACGYCSHPALDGNTCQICGAVVGTQEFRTSRVP